VNDEADATGIVFGAWVVQTPSGRAQTGVPATWALSGEVKLVLPTEHPRMVILPADP